MNQKNVSGLHPEAQRLLWLLVYNQSEAFDDINKPMHQLEQRGLVRFAGTTPRIFGGKRYEVTPAGDAELTTFAPFLKLSGRDCPPKASP